MREEDKKTLVEFLEVGEYIKVKPIEPITISYKPWINIDGGLPDLHKRVLTVGICHNGNIDYQTATYEQNGEGERFYWIIDGDHCDCCGGPNVCEGYTVTHWMEIPELPKD